MSRQQPYTPPYKVNPAILELVLQIGEAVGRLSLMQNEGISPRLRRENRLRTIQSSLAIENNSLTLEQVTAVISGKRVLGHPREIQEVRNAFAAYEEMESWDPSSQIDLLAAHRILMEGLVDEAGVYRSKGVGIYQGEKLIHMGPPAGRVPILMDDLFDWLKRKEEHPLIASCVFHYELEFIHPFSDGNGRMGRLWQSVILRGWKPLMAYLPVESIIHARQDAYYRALAESDQQGEATPFIEFMLLGILKAVPTDQVSDQVSDQVMALIKAIGSKEHSASELLLDLKLSHKPTFRKNYLNPALEGGWIERTRPEIPQSRLQRYRLTDKGRIQLKNK